MSANLVVDLFNNVHSQPSVPSATVAADGAIAISSGGVISSLSGVLVGDPIDLGDANTVCNVYVAGRPLGSGPLIIGVQTSDSTASGTFTDPTSGLAQMPGKFASGGQLILGSGAWTDAAGGIWGSGVSGQAFLSGIMTGSYFQRPHQYARLLVMSGFADVAGFQAGFITQLRTVGSGGGYSPSPSSGPVSV
jgi:hypothetical protein